MIKFLIVVGIEAISNFAKGFFWGTGFALAFFIFARIFH
jgi:hypothetical protein